MQPDTQGRVHAEHSGVDKGTVSQFFNYYKDDVVVALHFNVEGGGVNLGEAAETLATLFLQPVAPRPDAVAGTRSPKGR